MTYMFVDGGSRLRGNDGWGVYLEQLFFERDSRLRGNDGLGNKRGDMR
jgi:hypothetical protein